MAEIRLNKCPKCGEENPVIGRAIDLAFTDYATDDTKSRLQEQYVVSCETCRIMTQLHDSRESASMDWNRSFPKEDTKIKIGS